MRREYKRDCKRASGRECSARPPPLYSETRHSPCPPVTGLTPHAQRDNEMKSMRERETRAPIAQERAPITTPLSLSSAHGSTPSFSFPRRRTGEGRGKGTRAQHATPQARQLTWKPGGERERSTRTGNVRDATSSPKKHPTIPPPSHPHHFIIHRRSPFPPFFCQNLAATGASGTAYMARCAFSCMAGNRQGRKASGQKKMASRMTTRMPACA